MTLRIAVAGAGAVGCLLAARLAAAGHRVSLLARGAALEAVREGGVRLTDAGGTIAQAVEAGDGTGFGVQDAVLLCCKAQDLPALAEAVQPMLGPQTLLLPAVNGVPFWYFHGEGGRFEGEAVRAVDPDGTLARLLPPAQVIGTVAFLTAELERPGHAASRTPHLLVLGELRGGVSERLRRLCDAVAAAGIEARSAERIRDPLWMKIAANLSTNPLSVLTGATLEELYTRPEHLARLRRLLDEAVLAAAWYGARASYDPIEFVRLGAGMGPVRTSMLQDHGRGRPLELGAIVEAVLELAGRFDLPMPATHALLDEVRRMAAPSPPHAHRSGP